MEIIPVGTLPQPHEYWEKPPIRERGDYDTVGLFHGVGVALSTWENVELVFANMFSVFVESSSLAASRAYGAIASHSGRREALDNAAEIFFVSKLAKESVRADFRTLMKHFKDAATRRNEIAHGIVTALIVDDREHGIFLMPPDYNSRKTSPEMRGIGLGEVSPLFHLEADYRYVADDLKRFIERFDVLRVAATAFSGTISLLVR